MKTENEIWKRIEGYEGYEVSNFGNVRSLNYHRTGEIRVLKQATNGRGYLRVGLHKEGKKKFFFVHRLVAMAFLENSENLPDVNHKDEDKKNNRVENLEWCTRAFNINFGSRNERVAEKNTNGKLSKPVLQLTKNGEFVREWPSTMEIGRNGFNQSDVASCCRGGRKYHKCFIFRYKD